MPSVNPVTYAGFSNTKGPSANRFVLECVANMQDRDILRSSIDYADKESKKTLKRKFVDASVPISNILLPFCLAAATKGSLAKRAAVFSASMLGISLLIPALNYINKRVDNSEEKHPKLKEKNDKHPYIKSLMICAGTVVTGALLLKGGMKLIDKFIPSLKDTILKQKPAAAALVNNMPILKPLNNLNKEILKSKALSNCVTVASLVGVPLAWNVAVLDADYNSQKDMFKNASKKADMLLRFRQGARNAISQVDTFDRSKS